MSEPTFLSLAAWGGTANGARLMRLPVAELWAHHSVTNENIGVNPTDDAVADFLELDGIGRARGHGGISYSYAIHPSGVIGEGQGTHVGAHTAVPGHDRNPWSFGVVFIGNFNEDSPTPEAISSFRWLREKLIAEGHLVAGTYPTGGHRDAPGQSTACPGENIEAILDTLRQPYSAPASPTNGGDMLYTLDEQTFYAYVPTIGFIGSSPPLRHSGIPYLVIDQAIFDRMNAPTSRLPASGGGGLTEVQVRAIVATEVKAALNATTIDPGSPRVKRLKTT